jgi:hypothetical protein
MAGTASIAATLADDHPLCGACALLEAPDPV